MSGSRLDSPIRRDLIVRAAQRAAWAATALEHAGEDLCQAGTGDTTLEGLSELVLEQAELVSRMAQDIDSRRHHENADSAQQS